MRARAARQRKQRIRRRIQGRRTAIGTLVLLVLICALGTSPGAWAGSVMEGDLIQTPTRPTVQSAPNLLHFFTYSVQEGDTLSSIATQWGIPEKTIEAVNGGELVVGRSLKVPSFDVLPCIAPEGTTLQEIAACYRVSLSDLLLTNNYTVNDWFQGGETVYVPVGKPVGLDEINKYRGEFYYRNPETGKEYWIAKMIHPVTGKITGRFGEWRETGRHGGLDVAAPFGKDIVAPRDGVVSYVGVGGEDDPRELLGLHMWVQHTGGLMTLYAHISKPLALEGQEVATGDIIAQIGNNGRSSGDHLHFGCFLDGQAVDPLLMLVTATTGGD